MQSTEMSGIQRFVRRLLTDRGPGAGQLGGVALLGPPPSRSRRRPVPATDLLVWTPHGWTLVVLADFGSVQHGVLSTGPTGRWLVDDDAADLRTGKSTPNPILRGRKLRNELATIFRRGGLSEHIDVLVVLIPKTGSRISWTPRPPADGTETILVRIGDSAELAGYFERAAVGEVRWRGEDIARAFEMLGAAQHLPDSDELQNEGFPSAPGEVASGRSGSADRSSAPDVAAEPTGDLTIGTAAGPVAIERGRVIETGGPRRPGPRPARDTARTSGSEPAADPVGYPARSTMRGWSSEGGAGRAEAGPRSAERGAAAADDPATPREPAVRPGGSADAIAEAARDATARGSAGSPADPGAADGAPVRSDSSGRNDRASARPAPFDYGRV
ncbi:MAG: hypothetical protein HOQ36_06705, partial [Nocardia sp.]|nr:hypothetical protein [Nocardia sp.]